jgi:hypothetical protein
MRLLALCFIALATIASSLVSVSPAAAQAGTSDPTGGNKSSNLPAAPSSAHPYLAPQTMGDLGLILSNDLRMSIRFALARYISIGDKSTRIPASPADLPTRKRWF